MVATAITCKHRSMPPASQLLIQPGSRAQALYVLEEANYIDPHIAGVTIPEMRLTPLRIYDALGLHFGGREGEDPSAAPITKGSFPKYERPEDFGRYFPYMDSDLSWDIYDALQKSLHRRIS